MGHGCLLTVALTLTTSGIVAFAAGHSVTDINGVDNDLHSGESPSPFPVGDPRRCLEVARKNRFEMQIFEVLPGFGWDNLRNVNQGQVVSSNYSQCRTTNDGRFLLPDGVSAVPLKTSRVHTFAELFTHWTNWTSSTAVSINIDAGFIGKRIAVSGKFSFDYEDVKSKQIGDKSHTTRAQLRYVRYQVQLQPDTPLHPVFKGRLLDIAMAHELGEKEQARYLSEILVRDFGTHVVTTADAGAALEQVDQVHEEYVLNKKEQKTEILAAASVSLLSLLKASRSFGIKVDQKSVDDYETQRTDSTILTKGGAPFQPNFTLDTWVQAVDRDLVALDRAGDPLFRVITSSQLPELPTSVLSEVHDSVRDAIEHYYSFNHIPGCLDRGSPNFSPAANVDDGSCKPPPTNLTFGGIYQTCKLQPGSNNGDLCKKLAQKNPRTGDFSCPTNYQPVKLHSGSMTTRSTKHTCNVYIWIIKICHDDNYHSEASYDFYWCVDTGTVPQDSGYLFGGLYTSRVPNPLTRAPSCPSAYFALTAGVNADLHICVSDDYEQGEEFAVPFGGFMSCEAGNPLAVSKSATKGAKNQHAVRSPSSGSLKSFFQDQADKWPKRCPKGYSQHLATVDQGCQINYCIVTGALSGPVLPPVKRPPFVPDPPILPPFSGDLIHLNPAARTWARVLQAPARPVHPAPSHGLSPGATAAISIGATLACVAMTTLAVMAVRSRRQKRGDGYRRLQNPLQQEPQGLYGSVRESGRIPSYLSVPVDGESEQ